MKYLGTIVQYVTLLLITAIIYLAVKYHWLGYIPKYNLTWWQVILFGFVFAFTFVNGRHWSVKPFSCLGCMSGWITLSLGLYAFGWAGLVFLPVGYTVGALADRFITRFL